MITTTDKQRRAGGARTRVLVLLVLVGFGVGAYRWLASQAATDEDDSEVTKERPATSVVTAIQSLARLESVAFHMEKVIDIKHTEQALWGLVEAEDNILLVAVGDVVAGVDLGRLKPDDITLTDDGDQVRIVLPPPEIFFARLDNERTYVHARNTDLLATGGHELESDARRRAEAAIQQGAVKAGIMEQARRNAGHTVRALAMSFGYDNVILEWRPE